MRILYTIRIAPVISQADVSYYGLFIGLWTEAEVTLGFIVACSLCLPKLLQVKGKKIRTVFSYASAQFSSLSSKSRKSSLWSGSRKSMQPESEGLSELRHIEAGRARCYEDCEQRRQEQARIKPDNNRYDIYVLPSTAGSSEYSQSVYSHSSVLRRASEEGGDMQITPEAGHGISRSMSVRTQEVPIRLDPMNLSPEQLENERRLLQEFNFEPFRVVIDSERRSEEV